MKALAKSASAWLVYINPSKTSSTATRETVALANAARKAGAVTVFVPVITSAVTAKYKDADGVPFSYTHLKRARRGREQSKQRGNTRIYR